MKSADRLAAANVGVAVGAFTIAASMSECTFSSSSGGGNSAGNRSACNQSSRSQPCVW